MNSNRDIVADEGFDSCFLRWSIDLTPDLRQKFLEAKERGYVEDFSEYLLILERILEEPFPDKTEVERYLPTDMEVRSRYLEILEGLERLPDDRTSRNTFIRICAGSDYDAYREKACEVVERLDNLRKLSYSTNSNRQEEKGSRFLCKLHKKVGSGGYIVFITHIYLFTCFLIIFCLFKLL